MGKNITEVELRKTKKEIVNSDEYKRMVKDSYTAVSVAEGFGEGENASPLEQQSAWQYLHDSRMAYSLQGWFGRTAQSLIQNGTIFG